MLKGMFKVPSGKGMLLALILLSAYILPSALQASPCVFQLKLNCLAKNHHWLNPSTASSFASESHMILRMAVGSGGCVPPPPMDVEEEVVVGLPVVVVPSPVLKP
jgi:hypothetical protein